VSKLTYYTFEYYLNFPLIMFAFMRSKHYAFVLISFYMNVLKKRCFLNEKNSYNIATFRDESEQKTSNYIA